MRVQDEYFYRLADPAMCVVAGYVERMTGMDILAVSGEERPYRPGGPALPWCPVHDPPRFAVLSLSQICSGVKVKKGKTLRAPLRWQDHGTGLSKSAVAEAVNEAIAAGIIVRPARKRVHGRRPRQPLRGRLGQGSRA